MSDFSLMDAIECGIVKLPRVPVAENIPGNEMPMFRNLWENIRKNMPKKGRGKTEELDPLRLPTRLQTALEALYGHYEKTFQLWEKAGIRVPPCFIVVCKNTSIFQAGLRLTSPDFTAKMTTAARPWRTDASRYFATSTRHGNPLPRPNTMLIDSEQLEAGDALDDNFRNMAADEIERFRREIIERTGDAHVGGQNHRSGIAPRGHEHRRQVRPTGWFNPLRCLRLDADRRLGCQHRHARARHPRLRHPASVRAGHRPRPAPPVL